MNDSSPTSENRLALDFKSATLYAIRVVVHSSDMAQLLAALDQRMRDAGTFFENEPVVIDASNINEPIDWASLIDALRAHALHPIGAVAQEDNLVAAQACGLPLVDLASPPVRPESPPTPDKEVPVIAPPAPNKPRVPAAVKTRPEPEMPATIAPAAMVIKRPLRSGQRIYARNTDLIVIGAVNQGAEVIADGNIHVYGPLRGKAMAGARGDAAARIFTTQLDPELLAIAGVYRVIETQLDNTLHNQPVIVQLEGETLRIIALGA